MTNLDPNAAAKSPPSAPWHIHIAPDTFGPYTLQQLREYVHEGRMNADTLVWTEGADGWGRAGDQTALTGLFAGLTPAQPPAPVAAPRASATSYVLGASGTISANGSGAFPPSSAANAALAPGRIGFADAARICMREKYFVLQGRASRAEFWWFALFVGVVNLVAWTIAGGLAGATAGEGRTTTLGILAMVVASLVGLAMLPASIAVSVRRLHDRDRSGWWCLAQLIPVVGGIIALLNLFAYMRRGTVGPNAYGPDPVI